MYLTLHSHDPYHPLPITRRDRPLIRPADSLGLVSLFAQNGRLMLSCDSVIRQTTFDALTVILAIIWHLAILFTKGRILAIRFKPMTAIAP
jgi:hypothetical protein